MLKLLTLAALAFAAPAVAGDPLPVAPSVTVSVADLNLTTQPGLDRLNKRLATAVRRVCRAPDLASPRAALDERACRLEAIRTADQGRAQVIARTAVARLGIAAITR